MADLLEALGEDVVETPVAAEEVRKNLVELGYHRGLIHVHDPGKEADHARIWFGNGEGFDYERGDERPQQNAARVGIDGDGEAADFGFERHGIL